METKDGMTDMGRMEVARKMSERVAREEARKRGAFGPGMFAWSFFAGVVFAMLVILAARGCGAIMMDVSGTTATNAAATIGKEAGK